VHENIYGTSLAAVEKVAAAGRVCVLDIDVQGAEIVKRSNLDAVYVFVAPPSMEVWPGRHCSPRRPMRLNPRLF